MRDLFEIESASGRYPVRMSEAPVHAVVVAAGGDIVIADAFFRDRLAHLDTPVLFVDATEEAKEFGQVGPLIEAARDRGLARSGSITAVGGGVVQDIACFVASTYMRGVRWSYLPTTVLAMVDSCIGGKSSINVGRFKNLVGTFHPPAELVIPVAAVETLPPEHVAAGLCEAAKICFARGDHAWNEYLRLFAAGTGNLAPLIELSLRSKKWFVEIDEFDRAERLLLNFGHSFGHALESCTGYDLIHGLAVGVGCLSALEASIAREEDLARQPRAAQLFDNLSAILTGVADLPATITEVDREKFLSYWRSDKKHTKAEYKPILVDRAAHLYTTQLPRSDDSDTLIWDAFVRARARLLGQAPVAASVA